MAIIDDFVKCYKSQYSEYDMIRKRVESVIEKNLRDSGIMAITSSRVKDAGRLREKLLLRQKDTPYNTFEDIENDIVDFVGVRIALYFPNDQKKVDSLIHYLFDVEKTKCFPNEQRSNDIYSRRFSGYCATHYRVFEKENMSNINFPKRIRVEIQVASLLMHAWSEVEHDLTYKQKKGLVSFDEYESLDEINGLVIAGEISLQRLQRISELRITSESKVFSNHFQLASYIYDRVEGRTTHGIAMGDVETLFSVLKSQGRLTPKKVDNDLQKIDYSDTIPIAQQLIDMYADSNMKISHLVLQAKDQKSDYETATKADDKVVGAFLLSWIGLEKTINSLMSKMNTLSKLYSPHNTYTVLKEQHILSDDQLHTYLDLRKVRNELVHGVESPDRQLLQNCISEIATLNGLLEQHLDFL